MENNCLASDFGVLVADVVGDWVCAAGSEPEVSWPLIPGESGTAADELVLVGLRPVVEAVDAPVEEESTLDPELVSAGVPWEVDVVVLELELVLPGPERIVAIPVDKAEAEVDVVVETVAA